MAIHEGGVDPALLDPPPVRPSECSFSARNPWILIQAIASDMSARPRNLDIFTESGSPLAGAGGTAGAWWNVQEGKLAWTQDGNGSWNASQGVVFDGTDGRLFLVPVVSAMN